GYATPDSRRAWAGRGEIDVGEDAAMPAPPSHPDDPFRRAIRLAPADALPKLVFADYLDETGRPSEAATLRVLAEPDDDGHRLAFADVCEREGDADRVEFVRVQVALATLPDCGHAGESQTKVDCRRCLLRARERQLMSHKMRWEIWQGDEDFDAE